jgi:peroxiredoxin
MQMESKISPYPTSRNTWPDDDDFVRFCGVRRHLLAAILLIAPSASAAPPSNPAFLGIGFKSLNGSGVGPCIVDSVNSGSGAKDAGLRVQDVIVAIDGVQITNCDTQLSALIIQHQPGDQIRLDIERLGEHVVAQPMLSSRAEVLHRRWVGRALDAVDALDFDDGHAFDLGDAAGHTTVIGWFDLRQCTDCTTVLRRVASVLDKARRGSGLRVIAVTPGSLDELKKFSNTVSVGSQLAVVPEDFYKQAVFGERERVHFMVVDGRGIVRFVAPIAADADDLDAALDEVVAAAQQAEHARTARRTPW